MQVILYKRHKASCPYKADKTYRRCRCSVWMEWNAGGKQTRKSAKTFSWDTAQDKARQIESGHLDATLGRAPAASAEAKRVDAAIGMFMNSKRGEDLAEGTLYRHELTLKRLQRFCDEERIYHVPEISLVHLTRWRTTWPFASPLAKRNNQERIKTFFRFCYDAGLIQTNPAARMSGIQVKADESFKVRPFEPEEYTRVLAAISDSGLEPRSQARVRACMQLQRWSGLSLVDAVCLSKDELRHDDGVFRVRTKRRKTGAAINNVIPAWLGEELLRLENGNAYFFITGDATPKGAVSVIDKQYRRVFRKAGIPGTSHMFRHTFSIELLKAGVDIRKVCKALGHQSVTITERYYAKWNKAQQDIMDEDLTRA